MKVELNKFPSEVPASQIMVGESFLYCGQLHIRTCGTYSLSSGNWCTVRCVDLQTGRENGLQPQVLVIPVYATCVKG